MADRKESLFSKFNLVLIILLVISLILKVIFAQNIILEQTGNTFLFISIAAIMIHIGLTLGAYKRNPWAYMWIAIFTITYFWNFDFMLELYHIIDFFPSLYNFFDLVNIAIIILSLIQFFLALKRKKLSKYISM